MSPKPVALGLLVRGDEVLLLRRQRDPYGGLWSLPGGKVEQGEGLEETCARELREELGWDVAVEGLSVLVRETHQEAGDWLLAIFRCRPPAGAEGAKAPPDTAWFNLGGLDGLDMIPTDRLFIADALNAAGGPAPVRKAVVAADGRVLLYE